MSSLHSSLYIRLIEQLIQARSTVGMTQSVLAEQLKRPQSFVAKYEGRERRLDVAEYITVARVLGADPFRLMRAAERSKD